MFEDSLDRVPGLREASQMVIILIPTKALTEGEPPALIT
jgi:hypothetical protein